MKNSKACEVLRFKFFHKIFLTSAHFIIDYEGKMPLARHRMVNKLLEQELADGSKIHALTINAWTISQWEKKKGER